MESADVVSKSVPPMTEVPPYQWDLGRFKTCILSTGSGSNKTCPLITTTRCHAVPLCTELRSGFLGQSGLSRLFVALDSSQAVVATLLTLSLWKRHNSNTTGKHLLACVLFFFFWLVDFMFYIESISSCVMFFHVFVCFPAHLCSQCTVSLVCSCVLVFLCSSARPPA